MGNDRIYTDWLDTSFEWKPIHFSLGSSRFIKKKCLTLKSLVRWWRHKLDLMDRRNNLCGPPHRSVFSDPHDWAHTTSTNICDHIKRIHIWLYSQMIVKYTQMDLPRRSSTTNLSCSDKRYTFLEESVIDSCHPPFLFLEDRDLTGDSTCTAVLQHIETNVECMAVIKLNCQLMLTAS